MSALCRTMQALTLHPRTRPGAPLAGALRRWDFQPRPPFPWSSSRPSRVCHSLLSRQPHLVVASGFYEAAELSSSRGGAPSLVAGLTKARAGRLEMAPKVAGMEETLSSRMYRITFPDSKKAIFYDPCGAAADQQAIPCLRKWLTQAEEILYGDVNAPLAPLVISGAVKTGKSFFLSKVLPAVAAMSSAFRAVPVMELNLDGMPLKQGLAGMWCWLLERVVGRAAQLGITSPALREAQSRLDSQLPIRSVHILGIFREMDKPILILIDEVHKLLQPCNADGVIDTVQQEAAQLLLKELLCAPAMEGGRYCLWAVTGSSMTSFWQQLGQMPVNGFAPLVHCSVVSMPPLHSKPAKEQVLHFLQTSSSSRTAGLSPEQEAVLINWAPNVALLAFAYQEYRNQLSPVDMAPFLRGLITMKLARESMADWLPVLRSFSQQQRRMAAALYDATRGCDLSFLGDGMKVYLPSVTAPVREGRPERYLEVPFYREALQGDLLGAQQARRMEQSLGFLDAWFHLQVLGEKARRLLLNPDPDPAGHPGELKMGDLLETLLKDPAAELESIMGPADQWHTQRWLQQVWFSKYNQGGHDAAGVSIEAEIKSGGAAWRYRRLLGGGNGGSLPLTAAQHLAWYLYMLRNVISHKQDIFGIEDVFAGSRGAGGVIAELVTAEELEPASIGPLSSDEVELVAASPVAKPFATLITRFAVLRVSQIPFWRAPGKGYGSWVK